MSRGGRDPLFSLLEIRYIWGIYLEGYWFVLCPRIRRFKDSIRRMALKSLRIGWAVVRKDSCSSSCCRNQTQLVPLFGLRRFFMDCWQGDGSDDKCQSARLGRSISEDLQPVEPADGTILLGGSIGSRVPGPYTTSYYRCKHGLFRETPLDGQKAVDCAHCVQTVLEQKLATGNWAARATSSV